METTETAQQEQKRLRSLTDSELVHMLDYPAELSARDLALIHSEVESRGGIEAVRARVESLPFYSLAAVGFWKEDENDPLPHPADLVQRGGHGEEIPDVVSYLRTAQTLTWYLGHANCRFLRCAAGSNLGSSELTDGEWVWPEGLPHYIEVHQVMLPEDFINKMRSHRWQPPNIDLEQVIRRQHRGVRYYLKRWLDWSVHRRESSSLPTQKEGDLYSG